MLRNAQYMYVLYTNGLIFSLLFVIVGRSSDGSESKRAYPRPRLDFLGRAFKFGPRQADE